MLYLMMDRTPNTYIVKVGMSKNPSQRRRDYKSLNPLAIMRCECAGMRTEENYCHSALAKIGNRIKGTEWYIVSEEIFTNLYENGILALYEKRKKTSPKRIKFLETFETIM